MLDSGESKWVSADEASYYSSVVHFGKKLDKLAVSWYCCSDTIKPFQESPRWKPLPKLNKSYTTG